MNVQEKTRELIEVGRREVGFDEERLERNRTRILSRAVAVGVVGASLATATTSGAAASASTAAAGLVSKTLASLSLAKLAVAVVVVGGSVGGGYALATHGKHAALGRHAAPANHVAPSEPRHVAQPAAVTEPSTALGTAASETEAKPSPPAAPARAVSKPHASATSLTDHADLLRDARSALTAGDAGKALTLLDQHREVGRGPLGPEWAAARVLVLCRLGRVAEAKQLGARFLKAHASSPLAAQVAASCAGQN